MDTQQRRPLTDRELKTWLAAGQTDRGIGEGLTFVASASAASKGKASWILRYRVNGRPREKVLGRYPELSLKAARDQARKDRGEIERGVDVAAAKQLVKARITETQTVRELSERWLARYIEPRYKHPDVVARVFRKHINPVIGTLAPKDVHGSIHWLQCSVPCSSDVWSAESLQPQVSEVDGLWIGPLPLCRNCGAVARPNILLFGDGDWLSARSDFQETLLQQWLHGVERLLVLEIGAGTAVPTVRHFAKRLQTRLLAKIVRIDPADVASTDPNIMTLSTSAIAGLEALHQAVG
jgi:hypothetical protein